ncbi:MAG: CoA-acylating methylmalonate-semialdehyde dehydrogenase [Chitinivibrionales bacterium]|nr:CoA-acylating methylmalonate-semialdehyde dehydrogenase [Chitinivibrionales bacterium]
MTPLSTTGRTDRAPACASDADRPVKTHFVGGAHLSPNGYRTGDIYNPSLGTVQSRVELADAALVDRAVQSCLAALEPWQALNPQRRARVLMRLARLIDERRGEIARLIASEHGKTLGDADGEIQRGIEAVEFAGGIPHLMKGEFSDGVGTGIDTYTMRLPLGVVAGITPFNFPIMIPLWMIGNAVAAGNTFVLKPSEKDPSVPLLLGELLMEAGAPEGVLNVVNGDKEAVDAILAHPTVKAVSFVGSSDIAEYVYRTGAAAGKRVQAMGGAKNHMIVMPDADMEQAVNSLLGAAYGSAGERCMALSVVVPVGDDTAERLVDTLKTRVASLTCGPSLDTDSDFGPLVSAAHLQRVVGYIESGIRDGAKLIVDGRDIAVPGHDGGYYLGPCLFDHVRPEMALYRDEVFGPVLSIVRAGGFDEAVRLPSSHQYGNGVAVFTRNGDIAREFARRVDTGMVGVNVPLPVPVSYYSFGGWKRSAYGGFNQYGPDGVRFFTKTKTVVTRWPDDLQDAQFVMPTMK